MVPGSCVGKDFNRLSDMNQTLLIATGAVLSASLAMGQSNGPPSSTEKPAPYRVEGDAFVRHNGDRYNNRPLYMNHRLGWLLAGDKARLLAALE